jgi:hypothetical protein
MIFAGLGNNCTVERSVLGACRELYLPYISSRKRRTSIIEKRVQAQNSRTLIEYYGAAVHQGRESGSGRTQRGSWGCRCVAVFHAACHFSTTVSFYL